MVITKAKTFGPVAPLYRFKTDPEAIKMANDTEFGLAAYFYSRDIGRIWRVAEALEYGIVGINEGIISTEIAPFGGMKERRHRLGGVEIRHRGIPRSQIPLHARHRTFAQSIPRRSYSDLARNRTADVPMPVSLVRGSAEQIPFANRPFDTIVTTWTLCSIPNPVAALGFRTNPSMRQRFERRGHVTSGRRGQADRGLAAGACGPQSTRSLRRSKVELRALVDFLTPLTAI
jgi:hypothetical protein